MLKNTQPIEKSFHVKTGVIDFHSMFFTIQGEGPFTGERAVFIRLAGCNLQCPGCDTEYTSGRQMFSAKHLQAKVNSICAKNGVPRQNTLVVITGGEPLRQNIGPLVLRLLECGYIVQIETNGVLEPTPELELYIKQQDVYLVVSPKTSRINKRTAALACAFKYVLSHDNILPSDGLPIQALGHKASPHVARPPKDWNGPIFVNPMDCKSHHGNEKNLQVCAYAALKFGYRVGVQLHKLLDLE